MRATATVALLTTLGLYSCAPSYPEPVAQVPSTVAFAEGFNSEDQAVSRGSAIAGGVCASCHAVGRSGASPNPVAPAFRDIVRRRSLADVEAAMAEGLVTSHPAMPAFTFRASEIDDLIAYLETLRGDGSAG